MGNALASIGGFCVGDTQVCSHQRLSSAGYCFSASLPPFNATASSAALATLTASNKRVKTLRANSRMLHSAIHSELKAREITELEAFGESASPIVILRESQSVGFTDSKLLQRVCEMA